MTHDPMKSAAADAAATAAAYSARNTYALGWEAGRRSIMSIAANADLAHLRAEGAKALEEATAALVEMEAVAERWEDRYCAAESRIAVEASRADVAVRHLESCEDILRAVKRERDAEKSRADVAEQRVCELRDQLHGWPCCKCGHPSCNHCRDDADVAETLASTADIAGRWVSVEVAWKREGDANARADRLLARVREVEAERDAAIAAQKAEVKAQQMDDDADSALRALDAAIARAEKAEARLGHVMMVHQQAERARDEVGIQYAAAQAVIASWSPVIRASQALCGVGGTDKHSRCFERLCAAVAALDTVPGDALTHPTRHLEALGIDTANVKGGE